MDLPRTIKKKPWWMVVPAQLARSKAYAFTIGSVIYFPHELYENLQSSDPDPMYVSMMQHEFSHVQRIAEMGRLKFAWRYVMSRRFRFAEELLAMEASIPSLKNSGLNFEIERRARRLSSWVYGWCVDYRAALMELERAWNEAEGQADANGEDPR